MSKLTLTWLGQSGFVLDSKEAKLACDLYLSDYCKKRSKLDHTRLTPIPVAPESLDGLDAYLITHAHIDHFDPETVGPLMQANPSMRLLCPPSGRKVIAEFFPREEGRFEIVRRGVKLKLAEGVRLVAVPAAHEELEKDESGEYVALSYLLLFDSQRKAVFFAGDTIPYPDQAERILKQLPKGYALTMVLPVNGRDAARAKLGFKGNLTVNEAVALAKACGASLLVPCHFGMFALNDIKEPLSAAVLAAKGCDAAIPVVNNSIEL